MKAFASLLAGLLFGLGLAISGMTNPAKVIGFLDVTGRWDPSLMFLMGTALLIAIPAFQLAKRGHRHPLLAPSFSLPTRNDVDARLLGGASLFGVGWGISGFCPGPAIAGLAAALPQTFMFVGAMIAGMWLYDRFLGVRAATAPQRA